MDKSKLHNYQITACKHILENSYCGLFLDMGLGKTVITLTAIDTLLFDELEINSVLVVAPKRVVESVWVEECEKWEHLQRIKAIKVIGPEYQRIEALKAKKDVYVISRDNFAWLVKYYKNVLPFEMVVFDELSSFKSNKSMRFKAARLARPMLKRAVGLTGTPVPNGLMDLWAQMYILDRGERLEKTITRYRGLYFTPGKSNGSVVFNYVLRDFAEKTIHEKIKDICISMKANDYLELPEKVNNYITIKMPDALKKQYKDFEREKVLELIKGASGDTLEINVVNAAGLSNKLLQFANGAVYDENRGVHHIHDLKIDALKEIIEDANGQSVLVAWAYRHDLNRLQEALKEYKPRELKNNIDIDDWNAGRIQVMLAHPASAGHGLNLQTGGSIIVWFGLTWSLELYQQFIARLQRQGQIKTVIVHHLILQGTHDSDVLAAISAKDKKQENLIKAVKAKIQNYINYGSQ